MDPKLPTGLSSLKDFMQSASLSGISTIETNDRILAYVTFSHAHGIFRDPRVIGRRFKY